MNRNTILIVDDMEVNRGILKRIFQNEFTILEAANGEQAVDIIQEHFEEIAVVLLDIIMPVLDGFGVLEFMKEHNYMEIIPVILITGDTSTASELRGYELGVADLIEKPFDAHTVHKRIFNIVELYTHKNKLEEMVKEQTKKLEEQAAKLQETNGLIIDTLSTVVEFRNMESGQHIKRIRNITRILLECMSEYTKEYNLTPELIDEISSASAMHDIGKIAIPDNILLKPGRLNKDEFEIMKTHTTKGCEIIETFSFIKDNHFYDYCYDICRHHHERFDGKGYPDGLKGNEISIAAQVVSLADVYEALVSERVYKNAYSTDKAYEMIINGECGVFSPKLLECFKIARKRLETEIGKG